jgi:hypothetical protein
MANGAAREDVMTALATLLSSTLTPLGLKSLSRRLVKPESITSAQSPCAFLVEMTDDYQRQSPALPPTRHMLADLYLYNDIGDDPNAIPSTPINQMLDALDVALKPTDPSQRLTLNGLVEYVLIEGQIERAMGELTGKAVAAVPLKIVLP